jgi:hypothetical protein
MAHQLGVNKSLLSLGSSCILPKLATTVSKEEYFTIEML